MLHDKITVSFSDILAQTHITHEEIIKALAAEVSSGFQSVEANEMMVAIIILAGLEYLKLTKQLAQTNIDVCTQLLKLINGTGEDINYWFCKKQFLPNLAKLENHEPLTITGRQMLEGLLLCVCTKKQKDFESIEEADCNTIFQQPLLKKVMAYVKDHLTEERLSNVRCFEPDHITVCLIRDVPSIQSARSVAENLVAHSAIISRETSSASVETVAAAASSVTTSSTENKTSSERIPKRSL